MTRGNYGQLGKKRGNASWQWILLGFVLTSLCWIVAVFVLLAAGVFTLEGSQIAAATTPIVVTSEIFVTREVTREVLITTTPEPTQPQTVVVVPPTATPTSEVVGGTNIQVVSSPTPTPTATTSTAVQLPGTEAQNNPVPDFLASIASPLITITGGQFTMGTTPNEVAEAVNQCLNRDTGQCQAAFGEDSFPAHAITLDSFQIERTEVTFGQYVAFLNFLGPNSHRAGCGGFACIQTVNEDPDRAVITFDSANYDIPDISTNYPVYGVTWYGAQAYCQSLNRRLPTEAEWEYSARGTDGRVYPWGNQWDPTLAKTSRPVDAPQSSVPVGSYPLGGSPFGALDMAGNVAEWVADWYDGTYYTQQAQNPTLATNPSGPVAGTQKVVRGGSWPDVPFFSRSVHRQSQNPTDALPWLGFRCAANLQTTTGTSSGAVNPATLGVNTLTLTPQGAIDGAPTLPPPPEAGQSGG